jgi:serine/threonine protein kinase
MNLTWWQITLIALAGLVAAVIVITLVVMITVPVGRGIGEAIRRMWAFIKSEVVDFVRAIVAMLMAPIFAALALASLIFFQTTAARKFLIAAREELVRVVVCFYRCFIGNPGRLLGLERGLEGFETRLPGVLSGTWGDVLSPRDSLFPGYQILGTLPSGGSGAKLYIAAPDKKKFRELLAEAAANQLARQTGAAFTEQDRVVIKSFTTFEDATLPQLVRESRGLEAGKRLGLILDHGFGADRFYYIMRYVPGEHLRHIATRLHQQAQPVQDDAQNKKDGLDDASLRACLSYMSDLLSTLQLYHEQGLWHKDVKPDNIIIEPTPTDADPAAKAAGRARLVDVGLVSSLKSAMTLTTHGTEYYRDPEMVRQALRGVKVAEVDGTRFDLYAAGAVLYSIVEDSFPAQGVLSPIEKRCPPVIAWIIRRAMADYRQRYDSAAAMLEDIRAVASCPTMMTMRLADLPSVRKAGMGLEEAPEAQPEILLNSPPQTQPVSQPASLPPAPIPSLPSAPPAFAPTPVSPVALPVAAVSVRTENPLVPTTATPLPQRDLARTTPAPTFAEGSWWKRVTTPAFNAIGLPTRVKVTNWWTGQCTLEE